MYKEISIPIELSSSEFCSILESHITDNLEKLEPYILDGMWQHNDRANYVDDSLRIQEIAYKEGNEYVMYYEYDWAANLGCKDMDLKDTAECSVNFKLENGELLFNCLLLERPSPNDEL